MLIRAGTFIAFCAFFAAVLQTRMGDASFRPFL